MRIIEIYGDQTPLPSGRKEAPAWKKLIREALAAQLDLRGVERHRAVPVLQRAAVHLHTARAFLPRGVIPRSHEALVRNAVHSLTSSPNKYR